jgi:hypothetical protein
MNLSRGPIYILIYILVLFKGLQPRSQQRPPPRARRGPALPTTPAPRRQRRAARVQHTRSVQPRHHWRRRQRPARWPRLLRQWLRAGWGAGGLHQRRRHQGVGHLPGRRGARGGGRGRGPGGEGVGEGRAGDAPWRGCRHCLLPSWGWVTFQADAGSQVGRAASRAGVRRGEVGHCAAGRDAHANAWQVARTGRRRRARRRPRAPTAQPILTPATDAAIMTARLLP